MNINITQNGDESRLSVSGRLDSNTASDLENSINDVITYSNLIIFDFSELEYLSSAALRILFALHKKLTASNGTMRIININENIKEIFDITGMTNIFNID